MIFAADTNVLDRQASIHQQLAEFYSQAYFRLSAQATNIIHAFSDAQREDGATAYAKWASNLDHLLEEARIHREWAEYFTQLSNQVQQVEGDLAPVKMPGHVTLS